MTRCEIPGCRQGATMLYLDHDICQRCFAAHSPLILREKLGEPPPCPNTPEPVTDTMEDER